MSQETMTAAMKMSAVADSIALFQSELERAYDAKGVVFTSTLGQIVNVYAQALMQSAGIAEVLEYAVPQA